MAQKSVVVRLSASIDSYQRAMNQAKKSTQGVVDVGEQLTKKVTLPITAAGVAAVKMASDFDTTFQRMVGLAGVAQDEVAGLKNEVLALARETGRGPQDLAEGLYFIASAGVDASVRMDALKISAKGAASGLGTTASVADVVTSAISAYGKANITAAKAGDVLAATAREGKAEAASLAPQFGRLLPVASELGVRFDEVGASLAYLSRSGGGAELAATNLQNVLQKLLTPAQEGVTALQEIGLTTDDLRKSIKERGLLDTLVMLRQRLEQNGLKLGDFSRDAQFTTGVLALTADGGNRAREVFDKLADSTGSLDYAFKSTAKGAGFEFQQSLAALQVALIKAGQLLLPIAADIAGGVADIAQAFSDLPGPAQTGILVLLGMAAAAGPITLVAGKVTQLTLALQKMGPMGVRAASGLRAITRLGPIVAIAFGIAEGIGAIAEALDNPFEGDTAKLATALASLARGGDLAGEATRVLGTDLEKLKKSILEITDASLNDKLQNANEKFLEAFALGKIQTDLDEAKERVHSLDDALVELMSVDPSKASTAVGILTYQLEKQGLTADQVKAVLPKYQAALDQVTLSQEAGTGKAEDYKTATDEANEALDGTKKSAEDAEEAIKNLADALRAQFDPLFAMADALDANVQAQADLRELQKSGKASATELAEANRDVAASALDVHSASVELAGAIANGTVKVDDAKAMLKQWVTEGLITEGQARNVAGQFDAVAAKAQALDGKNVAMTVAANTAQAAGPLSDVEARLQRLTSKGWDVRLDFFVGNLPSISSRQVVARRHGGIVAAASGLDTTQAFIGRGTMIKAFEPETGGEAYVPRYGDANRSLSILSTAAAWYGARLAPAGGAVDVAAIVGALEALRADVNRIRPIQVGIEALTDRTATAIGAKAGAALASRGGF